MAVKKLLPARCNISGWRRLNTRHNALTPRRPSAAPATRPNAAPKHRQPMRPNAPPRPQKSPQRPAPHLYKRFVSQPLKQATASSAPPAMQLSAIMQGTREEQRRIVKQPNHPLLPRCNAAKFLNNPASKSQLLDKYRSVAGPKVRSPAHCLPSLRMWRQVPRYQLSPRNRSASIQGRSFMS